MSTNTTPRTSAVLRNGEPTYVREGAVAQDGSLKLMKCNTCGGEVVWATSQRTGRKYLVNVSEGQTGRFYMKNQTHDCAARVDTRAAALAVEAAADAYMAAFHALQAAVKSGEFVKGSPEHVAEIDKLDVLADAAEAAREAVRGL